MIPESYSAKTVDLASRKPDTTLLGGPNHKTQVIPETEPAKRRSLPLQWIVPFIFVAAAGALGLFVKQLRSPSGALPVFSNPLQTQNPAIDEATPALRSLANLSPGWVIKTNNDISLGNNQSLPSGTFLEVIEKKSNSQSASGNFSVSMRVCANKSTQTPVNTNNPAVTSSVPVNSKPLPATVLLNSSQLNRFRVSVLPSDAPSPCRTATQPPAIQSPTPNTSPTSSNTR